MKRSGKQTLLHRQSTESGRSEADERFQKTLERLVKTPPKPHKPKGKPPPKR